MDTLLLKNLEYKDYKAAEAFPLKFCLIIAKLAKLDLELETEEKPGKLLINTLNSRGFTVKQYKYLLETAKKSIRERSKNRILHSYYKPETKIAILIANDKYLNLSFLPTPSLDCDSVSRHLKKLGFIVVSLKNCLSKDAKEILKRVFEVVPEDSYCFIFYAGHGCELFERKYMLDVQCPAENITMENCLTENYVLKEVAKCKPDLCVFIMDMCRFDLDSALNPEMYQKITSEEHYQIENIKNLIITYSTQQSQPAYECIEIQTDHSISETYEIQTGDEDRLIPVASQYVRALCSRLLQNMDVSSLLDKVHGDVRNPNKTKKPQIPIKQQPRGVAKRSLYDPVKGDTAKLLKKLQEIKLDYRECLEVV